MLRELASLKAQVAKWNTGRQVAFVGSDTGGSALVRSSRRTTAPNYTRTRMTVGSVSWVAEEDHRRAGDRKRRRRLPKDDKQARVVRVTTVDGFAICEMDRPKLGADVAPADGAAGPGEASGHDHGADSDEEQERKDEAGPGSGAGDAKGGGGEESEKPVAQDRNPDSNGPGAGAGAAAEAGVEPVPVGATGLGPELPAGPGPGRTKAAQQARQTSKYRGVAWNKQKWRSQFSVNGVVTTIGEFECEVTAAKAVDGFVRKHRLARSRELNFPTPAEAADELAVQRFAGKRRRNSTSKYVGVSRNKRDQRWTSRIRVGCKTSLLGYFDTEEEAAAAYDEAAAPLGRPLNLPSHAPAAPAPAPAPAEANMEPDTTLAPQMEMPPTDLAVPSKRPRLLLTAVSSSQLKRKRMLTRGTSPPLAG